MCFGVMGENKKNQKKKISHRAHKGHRDFYMNENVIEDSIKNKIITIRGYHVILDKDLAELYKVETKELKRRVNNNLERFPDDFMIKLNREELNNLRCKFGTSRWGGTRYLPYAFTRDGILMLSSVFKK